MRGQQHAEKTGKENKRIQKRKRTESGKTKQNKQRKASSVRGIQER